LAAATEPAVTHRDIRSTNDLSITPGGMVFPPRSIRAALAGALAVVLLASACSSEPPQTTDEGPTTPDHVVYLTGFAASAHDAFIYVADEKGYFDEAGIEIDIQLGSGTQNLPALQADQAQFTYIDLVGLLYQMGKGGVEAGSFETLAAVHQSTLAAILAPESSDITSPQDLTGKRIGAFTGSPTEFLLPVYAEMAGFEFDPSMVVSVSPQELFGLLPAHRADALSTFIIQKGVVEQAAQGPMRVFPMNEVISDMLGTGLISTTALADSNPDLVTRFRDAALQGLQYTLDNPEEAIQILSDRNPGAVAAPPAYVAQINVMKPYITSEGEIGVLDEAHVMRCISVLESAGLIPSGLTPDAILGATSLQAS
jgi:NitT/TauT family transport system substrate-binding protein